MKARRVPKLAVWKFASCDGCQLTLLDCEDELLAVAGAVEIANFAEASRAKDDTATALLRAAREIDSLADRVEKGEAGSVTGIDDVLVRAYYTLAEHYYELASSSRVKKELGKSADRLTASVYYLNRALERSGKKADTAVKELLHRVARITASVRRGTGYSIEELGRTIRDLGREIERSVESISGK